MMRWTRWLVAVVAVATVAGQAEAGLVTVSTLGAFNTQVASGAYTETFDGPTNIQNVLTFTGGTPGFTYNVSASQGQVFVSGATSSGITFVGQTGATPSASLIFTPTSGNISAFGGNFFRDANTGTFQTGPVTVTATDNQGATASVTLNPTSVSVGSFVGFLSTGLITSITANPGGNAIYIDADNVVVGRAALATPEPSTLILAAAGVPALLVLGMRRYRRQQAA